MTDAETKEFYLRMKQIDARITRIRVLLEKEILETVIDRLKQMRRK